MRQWLVILGFMVLLPAIFVQYIAVNMYLAMRTGTPLVVVYLIPGVILTLLGFKTTPRLQVAKA